MSDLAMNTPSLKCRQDIIRIKYSRYMQLGNVMQRVLRPQVALAT